MTRKVTIFGATGSIGQSTLDLIRRGDYKVVALTGGQNITQLAKDAIEFGADCVVTASDAQYHELKALLSGTKVEVLSGRSGLMEVAEHPSDWIMSAIVGSAGLEPGIKALEQGTTLALANKESLVCAGPLMLQTAQANDATLLPVDSEHSAVFQALNGEKISEIENVLITASGGAFRDLPMEALEKVSVREASAHPNWDMGQRITIDSASMFNKALELIETKEFFGISSDKIDAVIHYESRVHAVVTFQDGAMMAHLGEADMRHPISYALNWPERAPLSLDRLDLVKLGQLTFKAADPERYPALRMAHEVMEAGGLAGAIFNAAKERALDAFIDQQIGFLDMARVVEQVLEITLLRDGVHSEEMTLDNVMSADALARRHAEDVIATLGS